VRSLEDARRDAEAARSRRDAILDDLERIKATGDNAGQSQRRENLEAGLAKAEREVEQLRDEVTEGLAEGIRLGIFGTDPAQPDYDIRRPAAGESRDNGDPHLRGVRDQALSAIERYSDASDSADRVEHLVRAEDPTGVGARYISAVGNPNYSSAFSKMLQDPITGHLRFGPEEVEAVRAATTATQWLERAGPLVTTTTGVPVPFQLDPSLMISGTGALNPLRRVARVETITAGTWKGATSAEVAAAYQAEAAEVGDATPAMTQPSITSQRGTAFIPFSVEIGQDWDTIVADLGRLLADGRDVLDATKMLTGTGTNEPGGILNIGGTGGLTTTQRVLSGGAGAVAIGDVYALKQALPARFIANATFAMHPTRLDGVFRLVASGSTTEPQIMPQGRNGPLVGKPAEEWSSMTTAVATGSKWAIFGDFSNFLIADRLGFQVELIPNLFGAAFRPTGQRGLLGIWRSGSGVLVANAFRYGETS
jgi:HK97 family phage major capsid protein